MNYQVEKFMVEKSGVEAWVEKFRVEMSFNLSDSSIVLAKVLFIFHCSKIGKKSQSNHLFNSESER